MGLLMALLLAGFLASEPPAVEKYDPWLDASNDGSVLATAQVCEFDEAELRQVVDALEQAAIQRATENGVSLDNATYREAFLAGNAKMHNLLNQVLPQQTEAQKQEACADVRTQWDLLRQIYSPIEANDTGP